MPPRLHLASRLGTSTLCFRPATKPITGPLPIIATANVATFRERRAMKDPYALAQSAQRKSVNVARQKVLREERKKALGDPVRGIPTPFVESFDTVGGSTALKTRTAMDGSYEGLEARMEDNVVLNHFLTAAEVEKSLSRSFELSEITRGKIGYANDPIQVAKDEEEHKQNHERATMAIARIVSLANSSQKDKTRANIHRCIQTFGRHNTDGTLRPRAPVNPEIFGGKEPAKKTPRAGPDTGSSEVQIAILTAKIRVLANQLTKKGGNKDKINKRNLRVMVHKRQKHLNYLRRKERGSDRWQNVIDTLGLTEGTWKGEISL
ncbi:hypothetical protein HYFRA_00013493 [Hymenoscyphus fraxineus]|uniref:Ribosomal protein S15 n=1 Tax=Hymenoscyphus fraxineus TaxID=746836 RepID=A0A9N9LAF8_9HELO|nr:hypothetical protein HYFRA_00013493 [Hymenoscyphus fraxineus]